MGIGGDGCAAAADIENFLCLVYNCCDVMLRLLGIGGGGYAAAIIIENFLCLVYNCCDVILRLWLLGVIVYKSK